MFTLVFAAFVWAFYVLPPEAKIAIGFLVLGIFLNYQFEEEIIE